MQRSLATSFETLSTQGSDDLSHAVQGIIDEVPQLLADFPGPLSAQSSRERLLHHIAARTEAHCRESWCSEPDALKV